MDNHIQTQSCSGADFPPAVDEPLNHSLESPPKPQKPPQWETSLNFLVMVVCFTVGCCVNGFLWIACINHLDFVYLSGHQMMSYLENFQDEATGVSQAKIVAKFLQPPTDTPVVVVSYSVVVSKVVYRVQKIFVNNASLYALVHQHGSTVVMTHPRYPLSGLPSWEFQQILREQRNLQRRAWMPFLAVTLTVFLLHYFVCTLVWARWISTTHVWLQFVLSPFYHMLTTIWLRQRQLRRFQRTFLSGTMAGPPESWSVYVEVQREFGLNQPSFQSHVKDKSL